MTWLKARLAEPSTHAALAGAAACLIPLLGQWSAVASAAFAALGFGIPEKTR